MSWAVSLPIGAAGGLGPLRFLSGAEACGDSGLIWLRGAELSETDEVRLRQLPGAQRFSVNERMEIVPSGSLLPAGLLPSTGWQPLRTFLEPVLSELKFVSGSIPRLPLTLVRDTEQREVAALLTTMSAWRDYALTAPQVRLAPLKFAACRREGEAPAEPLALIIGNPLPPLAGERFWEQRGLFIAAGWHWSPASTLR